MISEGQATEEMICFLGKYAFKEPAVSSQGLAIVVVLIKALSTKVLGDCAASVSVQRL